MLWDIPRSSAPCGLLESKELRDKVKSIVLLASISPKAKNYCSKNLDLVLDILVPGMYAVLAPLGTLLTASCSLDATNSCVKHLWLFFVLRRVFEPYT